MANGATAIGYDPDRLARALDATDAAATDATWKGIPPSWPGPFGAIGAAGLSLRRANLPLPVAVLKQSALAANRAWMRQFLALSGAVIAPHGKTTMAPRLFQMQLQDGAWGITAATAQQAAILAGCGITRILLANQLVGDANIGIALGLLRDHPALDFYCVVDSADNAHQLASAVQADASRPLQVLVEIGAMGGRTGVRSVAGALDLARTIRALRPALSLRGVEAYEDVFGGLEPSERERRALSILENVRELATRCHGEGLFDAGPVVLTAGGTTFLDLAGFDLSRWGTRRDHLVVIRSGCYLTHDSLSYERAFQNLRARAPGLADITPPMTAAVEVWAAVQSRPEPGLAIATMGKRDVSYDVEMPVPLWHLPRGSQARPAGLPPGHRVLRLNDQHAFLSVPEDSPLAIGDSVGFGVSHVCTTFDKWRSLLLVDDDYDVTGAIRTFF